MKLSRRKHREGTQLGGWKDRLVTGHWSLVIWSLRSEPPKTIRKLITSQVAPPIHLNYQLPVTSGHRRVAGIAKASNIFCSVITQWFAVLLLESDKSHGCEPPWFMVTMRANFGVEAFHEPLQPRRRWSCSESSLIHSSTHSDSFPLPSNLPVPGFPLDQKHAFTGAIIRIGPN